MHDKAEKWPDEKLVDGIRHGDEAAARQLIERYERALWGIAWRCGRHEADDFYGAMLLQVFCAVGRWDGRSLDNFVLCVARNRAFELLRARRRRPVDGWADGYDPAAPDNAVDLKLAIDECFSRLGGDCQRLIRLSSDGWKPIDIAAELGVQPSVIYARLYRCRERMRQCLDGAAG